MKSNPPQNNIMNSSSTVNYFKSIEVFILVFLPIFTFTFYCLNNNSLENILSFTSREFIGASILGFFVAFVVAIEFLVDNKSCRIHPEAQQREPKEFISY